jgi:hypothetical protein
MKQAICKLRGITPVTFGKFHQTEKLPKELAGDFEQRTWREKLHVNNNNNVILPGTMFGNCIRESAKFMSIQIPGKGKATYTKHFEAGIIIKNDIVLPIKKEDVVGQPIHVPSDGRPGGTTRVIKIFPRVDEWEGTLTVLIGDEIITADIFEQVLVNGGNLIGIGTWRPRKRGMNGRFELIDMQWK